MKCTQYKKTKELIYKYECHLLIAASLFSQRFFVITFLIAAHGIIPALALSCPNESILGVVCAVNAVSW